MLTTAEALSLLHAGITALPARVMPLAAAAGHVTAAPARARLTVPGFANAAMDGYALHAADTAGAAAGHPVHLPVAGLVAAGTPPRATADGRAGTARATGILTGAPVPADCDAVVPLERVTLAGSGDVIALTTPLHPGQNVRQAGEDFTAGQVVVPAGVLLEARHLMGLAACGIDELWVAPRPRVAVLTTGSELEHAGAAPAPGHIRDANGPYLAALLPALGAEPVAQASAGDEPGLLGERLLDLAARADLVLTTGGVSAGRLDLLPDVVRAIGGEIVFHKVAIRPGKPLLHARLPGGALLFGLPGNPLAVAVGMRFFVTPALRRLQGLPPEQPAVARVAESLRGRGSLRFFAKARREVDATGVLTVRLLPGQESFRIAPLLEANCWAVVPEDSGDLPAGALLDTVPL